MIGGLLLALGLVTAFGGVVLRLGQARLQTLLAHSTISQMGLVLVGFAAIVMPIGQCDAASLRSALSRCVTDSTRLRSSSPAGAHPAPPTRV